MKTRVTKKCNFTKSKTGLTEERRKGEQRRRGKKERVGQVWRGEGEKSFFEVIEERVLLRSNPFRGFAYRRGQREGDEKRKGEIGLKGKEATYLRALIENQSAFKCWVVTDMSSLWDWRPQT